MPVLRKLAAAVGTDKGFVLLLSLVAAVFYVARAYVDAPAYAPTAKWRRAGATPPANAPPGHTPDLNRGSSGGGGGVGPQCGSRAGPGAGRQGTKVAKGGGRRRGRK